MQDRCLVTRGKSSRESRTQTKPPVPPLATLVGAGIGLPGLSPRAVSHIGGHRFAKGGKSSRDCSFPVLASIVTETKRRSVSLYSLYFRFQDVPTSHRFSRDSGKQPVDKVPTGSRPVPLGAKLLILRAWTGVLAWQTEFRGFYPWADRAGSPAPSPRPHSGRRNPKRACARPPARIANRGINSGNLVCECPC
jgi:hypothetical protein